MLRQVLRAYLAVPLYACAAQFQVQVTPAAPSLSDIIRIDVRVNGTDAADLAIDPADIPSDCVRIQNVSDQGLHQVLTLDPVKPGPCALPPFRVRCLHGRRDSCDARSEAVVIPIHTVVRDPKIAEIRDTEETPIVPSKDPKDARNSVLAIGLAIAAAVTCLGLLFFRWRAWRGKPVLRAQRRLRQLRKGDASFSELQRILREYLDERIGLRAHFCSSPELMDALRARSIGLGSTEEDLRNFLSVCDHGRFARLTLQGTLEEAIGNCREIIECLDSDIGRSERARL
ncbi:MAG TPA: hypothetical protein VHC90_21780 [Bryobacteraceae bacterium]|nr:hypothetical protein [Bryobacteraceae bacterium]